MATKSARNSKQQTSSTGRVIVPELVVRDPDVKYMGDEPLFALQPDDDRRSGALVKAFNWYNRFFDRKMAKDQLSSYLEYIDQPAKAKQMRRVDDKEVMLPFGWLARLHMRGLDLTEAEQSRLDAEITRLINTLSKPEVVVAEVEKSAQRTNVQEVMRERAREAAGDLEGLLDEFISSGAKATNLNVSAVGPLSEKNVLPQHVSILVEVWKKKQREFMEVLESKDPQLNEAYKHYGKNQIKSVIKFIESILAGLDSYINIKKASKAPRKRKAVPVEKQVSKIKFLKTFEELKLVSVHPGKIIGASEVWAYDTAKRKLWYLVADSHVGVLGVKGATILGFDTSKSGVKTVRKPNEIIKKLMAAGKPASRKVFSEINSVQAQPNGRTNENLIFLKVY